MSDTSPCDQLAEEAIAFVRRTAERRSVLCVLDLTGTAIDGNVIRAMKRLSKNNGPYIRRMTFVGFNWLWSYGLRFFLAATGRKNHAVKPTVDRAFEWLVSE